MAAKRATKWMPALVAPERSLLRVGRASRRVAVVPTAGYKTVSVSVSRWGGAMGLGPRAQTQVQGQRRWYSVEEPKPVEERKSRAYEFEDIQAIVEDPKDTTVLIDVREPTEYFTNAIPTALNIPITSQPDALLLPPEEFADRFGFSKPPLSKEVVFYCKAGVRSAAAAQIAKKAGYTSVGEYKGSWLDWERRGGVGTKTGPKREGQPGGRADTKEIGESNK
ncbi:Rhodanese-like domain-containing protein [Clohesyomyces aquaticus]|uniref:Rhodanese-like domain-containing protein n=1 Tax=Clohesyomyces aquaticus TaxID=1231657 RepID=A0A1Y1ZBR4_9PLEO|nr:Rhodanese-like domain-containing protein [Clohesyomyces aquaticus]